MAFVYSHTYIVFGQQPQIEVKHSYRYPEFSIEPRIAFWATIESPFSRRSMLASFDFPLADGPHFRVPSAVFRTRAETSSHVCDFVEHHFFFRNMHNATVSASKSFGKLPDSSVSLNCPQSDVFELQAA
jgi:hypothetical protein